MPVAFTSTSTSPTFGPSRSTSVRTSGLAFSNATAARVFMSDVLLVVVISRNGRAGGTLQASGGGQGNRLTQAPADLCPAMAVAHDGGHSVAWAAPLNDASPVFEIRCKFPFRKKTSSITTRQYAKNLTE